MQRMKLATQQRIQESFYQDMFRKWEFVPMVLCSVLPVHIWQGDEGGLVAGQIAAIHLQLAQLD